MNDLAWCYQNGQGTHHSRLGPPPNGRPLTQPRGHKTGVAKDMAAAVALLTRSAKQGNKHALNSLAWAYQNGAHTHTHTHTHTRGLRADDA